MSLESHSASHTRLTNVICIKNSSVLSKLFYTIQNLSDQKKRLTNVNKPLQSDHHNIRAYLELLEHYYNYSCTYK